MAAPSLSVAPGVVALRPCKRLPHNCAAGASGGVNGKPICISIPWSNGLPSIYRSAGRELQSAKYDFGSRHWPHLWICCIYYLWCRKPAFWCPPRDGDEFFYLLAKNPRCSAFALGYGRVHGSVARQSSTRRCDHPDRFTGNHLETQRACHHRSRRVSPCRSSARHQSDGWVTLSHLEISRNS